jgi:hypothetical protein
MPAWLAGAQGLVIDSCIAMGRTGWLYDDLAEVS